MMQLERSDDNEIIGRIKAIKFLRSLEKKIMINAEIVMKQDDYMVAQKFRASIAVNEEEIEFLRNLGPKVKISP